MLYRKFIKIIPSKDDKISRSTGKSAYEQNVFCNINFRPTRHNSGKDDDFNILIITSISICRKGTWCSGARLPMMQISGVRPNWIQ
jgi:hypothetical protein